MPLRLLVILLFLGSLSAAQQAAQELASRRTAELVPNITFTRNWENATPAFLKIEVESSGRAAYTSLNPKAQSEPYVERFTLSQATRQRIFDLAAKTDFFNGDFDFKRHAIAFTGTKTLAYHDAAHTGKAIYNWSENRDIEQLTAIFIGIANTVEAGRRVDYLIHYDRLGLDQELQAMEREAAAGDLQELELVAPSLREIAAGSEYMHIAQERARRLLQRAER